MIEVNGLTRYYGDLRAIEGLSFRIGANEIVGFLGLNGAGKSTTLRILAGLTLPTAGTVTINGEDLLSTTLAMRSEIGFLPEDPPLHREMTTRNFLRYVGRLRGMDPGGIDDAVVEVAHRCAIHQVLDQVVGTLSYGYQKRVGIAQAIIHGPRLVILDEPIAGLDPIQIVEMRSVISSLRESCTVLVSSHILSEIHQTCDRIFVFHQGSIVAEGTEEELARKIQPSTRIRLTLRDDQGVAEPLLQANEWVSSFQLDRGTRLLQVRVDLTGDHREQLVAALVQAGVGIRRVDDAEAELEHIFVELTREEAA